MGLSLLIMDPGMLLAMFIVWELEGHPHYASMGANQKIAYISDIGAQGLKPLFIAGCVVTTIFLDLSFASERWLRHTGRLAKNLGMAEKVLSGLSSMVINLKSNAFFGNTTLIYNHRSGLRPSRNMRPDSPFHFRYTAPSAPPRRLPPPFHCWLRNQRSVHLRRISKAGRALPPASHPAPVILGEADVHFGRGRVCDYIRFDKFRRRTERGWGFRVDCCPCLHVLCAYVLYGSVTGGEVGAGTYEY